MQFPSGGFRRGGRDFQRPVWRVTRLFGWCAVAVLAVLVVVRLVGSGFPAAAVRALADAVPRWAAEWLVRDARPGSFGLGSSERDVERVQGKPSRVEGSTWFYGDSEVRFAAGRVVGWRSGEEVPLRTGP